MERLLQYVWKYKLYTTSSLITTSGQPITVFDPGIQNTDAGPDFFNAKIKIGTTEWAGNVEIHQRASDWQRHGHAINRIYDSVILHVVADSDIPVHRTNGELIPQLVLHIPQHIRENYAYLLGRERSISCIDQISCFEPLFFYSWMESLLSERLERKTQDILRLLEQYSGDWNEVFYIILCRSFGFGINSDAMEMLARSLPFRYLQKHRADVVQVEALLFGQAGLLNESIKDTYVNKLQQEYIFLRHKFNLHPIEYAVYRSLRIRPANFPHIKLAQIAAIWVKYDTLFSLLREADTADKIRNLLSVEPSIYWETHYHFQYASVKKEKRLGESALNVILINAVVPMLFAYGIYHKTTEFTDKALRILETLPSENNSIVTLFRRAGVPVLHAGDSQALIQLKRVYCENRKCLYCRIGFKLLQKK